jgi:hypothetical protein
VTSESGWDGTADTTKYRSHESEEGVLDDFRTSSPQNSAHPSAQITRNAEGRTAFEVAFLAPSPLELLGG